MSKRARLEILRRDADTLSRKIQEEEAACEHKFGDPVSDPIEEPRMEFDHYEGKGSDPNPVYKKVGTKSKPRWKRTCANCGKVEYTTHTKSVRVAPDFG